MGVVSRLFGALRPAYLIRAYVIGLALFLFMAWMRLRAPAQGDAFALWATLAYFLLCTLLFPFAKLVWDELRNLAFGNNIIVMNAWVLLILKFMVNALLWGFAVIVAPLGLVYLWFRTRDTAHRA